MESKTPPEIRVAELYSTIDWSSVDSTSRFLTGMLQLTYTEAARNTQRAVNYSTCRISTLFMVGFAMLVSHAAGMSARSSMLTVLVTVLALYVLDVFTTIGFKKLEDERFQELEEEIKTLAKSHPPREESD